MAIFNQKNREDRELGFGTKNYKSAVRFINRDGSVNVKRTGLGGINNIDVYHWLISIPQRTLILVIVCGYAAINLIFAYIYYLVGPQHFGGLDASSEFQKFMGLFFFSAQTITTLGYGHIYPTSNGASIAAAVESLMGLLSFAIATGVLFGRFSRPKAEILYSKNILISPYGDVNGLMFRISNKMQYELMESEASVTMTMNNPTTNKREFLNLALEINHINYLALSWTLVHPIDENSPIYGLTAKDLEERDAEILILVKAINDTFSQTVYSRYSYKWDDIVEKAKFKPLKQEPDQHGRLKISITDIHLYDKVG
jgi:inward rectifier potassium channel